MEYHKTPNNPDIPEIAKLIHTWRIQEPHEETNIDGIPFSSDKENHKKAMKFESLKITKTNNFSSDEEK